MRRLSTVVACLLAFTATAAAQPHPDDARWWGGFGPGGPGVFGGSVRAIASSGCDLMIAGSFNQAGGAATPRFTIWDGARFQSVQWEPDFGGGSADAIAVDPLDPSKAFVATTLGVYERSGGSLSLILPLSGGSARHLHFLEAQLHALGELFNGTQFEPFMRRFDGLEWASLPPPPLLEIDATAVHAGQLLCAGLFDEDANLHRVFSWDGQGWSQLGPDIDESISGIASDGVRLMIAASWDGVFELTGGNWTPQLAAGRADAIGVVDGAFVCSMRVWPSSESTLWRLDSGANQWSPIGIADGTVRVIAEDAGSLVIGGGFSSVDGVAASSVARYDGAWAPLGSPGFAAGQGLGLGARPEIFVHQDELIVFGANTRFGAATLDSNVGVWDGESWSELESAASGVNPVNLTGGASDGTTLVAFGQFSQGASGSLGSWDGTDWTLLPALPPNAAPAAIAWFNGELHVAARVMQEHHVFRLREGSWELIGVFDGFIYDLHEHAGSLYVAGAFLDCDGQPCSSIAAWDGASWSVLDGGLVSSAPDTLAGALGLATAPEGLIVTGSFVGAGSSSAAGVAVWSEGEWTSLGFQSFSSPQRAVIHEGQLHVVGAFFLGGSGGVARLDGETWRGLGSGVRFAPNSIGGSLAAASFRGDLFVAGNQILLAGGKPSIGIARWGGAPFDDPIEVPTNGAASSIAVALFDEAPGASSGFADLAIANADTDSVTIVRNLGLDGSNQWLGFEQTPASYAVGAQPVSVAAADWDGDGLPDVITANAGEPTLSVLLNAGGGAFTGGSPIGVPGPASWLAAVDNDDDKDLDDIAATIPSLDIVITVPGGGGGVSVWPVGAAPSAVASADFNGDSVPDLAVANRLSGDLSLLLGLGAGQYAPEVRLPITDLCAAPEPVAIEAGDVNADGWIDLAIANSASDTIALLINMGEDGAGVWQGFEAPVSLAVGDAPSSVTLGDFALSGLLDVVSANSAQDSLSYLRNATGEVFEVPVEIDVSPGPVFVTTADFDNDGLLDLISASAGGGGARGAAPGVQVRLNGASGADPLAPCPGDTNGDRVVDFSDLNAVLVGFGLSGPDLPGDLDGDGLVSFADLNEVLVAFGGECE